VRTWVIVLVIWGIATTAIARPSKTTTISTNTAGELADVCGVKPADPAANTKRTFCQGFAQGAISVELRHAGQEKPFCFPRPAPSRAETMKQFVDWIGAMPERRSLQSTDALFRFLSGRYPCKATQPSGDTGIKVPKAPEPTK
jgi:hypothetical protein